MSTALTPQLTDLTLVLETAGVEIARVSEREITGKCPVHLRVVGKEDRSPSWSMNASSGLWICFSCGARGTLSSLLHELCGDTAVSAQQFLINAGAERLYAPKKQEAFKPELRTDAFFGFDRVSDKRCATKNLDPDLVHKYGVRWNSTNKSWAIPIISPMGQLMGWQEKKTDWVRNFPVGVEKAKTLFGVERFRNKTAILVESPLDVVRFAMVFSKPQAVASFGAQVSKEQMNILTHMADTIIVAMDNDAAGIESSKKLYKFMGRPRKGLKWWNYKGTDAKDIGDMTDDEIEAGLMSSTVVPPWML
jgi:hypothetical protein